MLYTQLQDCKSSSTNCTALWKTRSQPGIRHSISLDLVIATLLRCQGLEEDVDERAVSESFWKVAVCYYAFLYLQSALSYQGIEWCRDEWGVHSIWLSVSQSEHQRHSKSLHRVACVMPVLQIHRETHMLTVRMKLSSGPRDMKQICRLMGWHNKLKSADWTVSLH